MKFKDSFTTAILLILCFAMSCTLSTRDSDSDDTSDLFDSDKPVVVLLKNRVDTVSTEIAGEITKALRYTKIPYKNHDLGLLGSNFTIPETARLLCITTTELERLSNTEVEQIVRFAAEGNTIVVTSPIWDNRFGFLQGIKKDASYTINNEATEFIFNENVYPNFARKEFSPAFKLKHAGLNRSQFKQNIDIIAHAKNDAGYPVILRNKVGLGKVLLFNSSILNDKVYRGILFSAISSGLSGIPYPVINVSTIFLDDFPAPLYNEKLPPIDTEYDITHAQFVAQQWWPDMKAFADTFNIDYSAMTSFNYNANVVPPFDFNEWRLGQIQLDGSTVDGSLWLADDVAKSRHELAFHGYNHFSLWEQDWPNQEFMITAVQAAKKRWVVDDLGSLPVTYVPPTNEIDSLGLVSVKKGMPSLQYMASLYIGDIEDGGGREFGPDPYVPSLFDYPRITSGFYNFDNSVFEQNSLYQLTGIWTHFIHPDDVFQVEQREEDTFASRNKLGLGWHKSEKFNYGLYEVFRERIIETRKRYPFIRFLAAEDAAPIVQEWLNASVSYTFNRDSISFEYSINDEPYTSSAIDTLSYWFMFADESHAQILENKISKLAEDFTISEFWDGTLIQFSTEKDSISLPNLSTENRPDSQIIGRQIRNVISDFRSYIAEESTTTSESMSQEQRFEYALAVLNNNPDSKGLQERVIELAVEQEQVDVAIKVLESRLINKGSDNWQKNDIERLFTYYGWENRIHDGWKLLNKLWAQNQDNEVILAKDNFKSRYGYPDDDMQNRWLERELAINSRDEEALKKFVILNQSQKSWPRTKSYLQQLIRINAKSDSLYHYTLQRSLYYDDPQATIELLERFPESAIPQLQPLSGEIANLYAYSLNDFTRALQWAERVPDFPVQTELEWLLQQKRYNAFIERGNTYLTEHTEDDSIRVFLGHQLIYEGFYERGYETLYPLFQEERVTAATRRLVHTEIGYKSYAENKVFYKQYPAFYSDSLKQDIQHKYRLNEGIKAGLSGSYASDNFENTIDKVGAFAEWGNRQNFTHRITLEEIFLGSDFNGNSAFDQLTHLDYHYRRKYREQSMQSTIGGGLYYTDGTVKANAELGFWYAKDSTFTSGEVTVEPVLTNTAVQQNINQYKLLVYREDFWVNGKVQTTISGSANYYTDEVFSFETLGRAYVRFPFSTAHWRYRGIGELSYSDASVTNTNGIPYYTPDNLLIEGGGIDFSYRDILQNPDLSIELELMGKNDSRDGFFLTSAARLNARLDRYWELSLNADISSSRVYRYNNFGFRLSYIFPRSLPEH